MNKFKEILFVHFDRYPKMEPVDAVKLIYQNEFGCGHLITDETKSLENLEKEYNHVMGSEHAPHNIKIESIGNGLVRIYLTKHMTEKIPLSILNKMFLYTSKKIGSLESFKKKLNDLTSFSSLNKTPFSKEVLSKYIEYYIKIGYPLVSHSNTYHNNYSPSYRVIDEKFIPLLNLIENISKKLETSNHLIVALDGKAGSGKTTAAILLSSLWDSSTIHMDDFFLTPELRTVSRLQEPGGNIHYERFKEEVVKKIHCNKNFSYNIFNCHIMDFDGNNKVSNSKVILVEGSYSLHPFFGKYYDVSAYLTINESDQLERIRTRCGEKCIEMFKSKWIPLENKYNDAYHISSKSDFLVIE